MDKPSLLVPELVQGSEDELDLVVRFVMKLADDPKQSPKIRQLGHTLELFLLDLKQRRARDGKTEAS